MIGFATTRTCYTDKRNKVNSFVASWYCWTFIGSSVGLGMLRLAPMPNLLQGAYFGLLFGDCLFFALNEA
jgi:hypothetical protein